MPIIYYACNLNDEQLMWRDKDKAIASYLEECGTPPETLLLKSFSPLVADMKIDILDYLLEILDDEYGNPNESTKPTESMRRAEEEFIKKILEEYRVYSCEQIGQETIDVHKWCVSQGRDDLRAKMPAISSSSALRDSKSARIG